MDEIIEWVFHALRVVARFIFQVFFEILLEYFVSPLARSIAAIYRPIRDFFRVVFRFNFVANPLAALTVIVIFSGPLFIFAKVIESFLMWW